MAGRTAPSTTIALLDQPTIVTNTTGQRPVENIVGSAVSLRHGGMQPANTSRTEMFGPSAPIWPFLTRFGGPVNPLEAVAGSAVIEIYPVLAEEELLLEELNERRPRYTPIVVLAMHTGSRASELLRGEVGDYNRDTRKLAIHQTKVRNSSALRYVPMDPMAIAAYEILAEDKKAGDPLCTQPDGKTPVIETKYWFDECVDAAKLEDFRFHDLGHTAASR